MKYGSLLATWLGLSVHAVEAFHKQNGGFLSLTQRKVGYRVALVSKTHEDSGPPIQDDEMDNVHHNNNPSRYNKRDHTFTDISNEALPYKGDVLDAYDAEESQGGKHAHLVWSERFRNCDNNTENDRPRESCLIVAVDTRSRNDEGNQQLTLEQSLNELYELAGTAGLVVKDVCVQRMSSPSRNTYVGPGKISQILEKILRTEAKTLVIDGDLTPKQQRNMEAAFAVLDGGEEVKILDRTAIILDIFAQRAQSKEGKLQVELAQMQYRLTRGPRQGHMAEGDSERDSGAGFRGPGEKKMEVDKRFIRNRIVQLKKEIAALSGHRENNRRGRYRLGLPLVALVGYTNAGKSTILNRMTQAGVLAENMLFATLDSTVRRVRLNKGTDGRGKEEGPLAVVDAGATRGGSKGQEILLVDTVGFISNLPPDLLVAFRSTFEHVTEADVLIHVCDRSNPMWRAQRDVVLSELAAVGCAHKPIVELWNKIDLTDDPLVLINEARKLPVETDLLKTYDYANLERTQQGRKESAEQPKIVTEKLKTLKSANNERKRGRTGVEAEAEEDQYAPIREGMEPKRSDSPEASSIRWNPRHGHTKQAVAISTWHESNEKARRRENKTAFRMNAQYRKRDTTHIPGNIRVVAASAKSGLGFRSFVSCIEDALSFRLQSIKVFIPYDQDDGIIDTIYTVGKVDSALHGTVGTSLSCRVPEELYRRLVPFRQQRKQATRECEKRSSSLRGGW